MAIRISRVIPYSAAAYIVGGGTIFAATMLPWVERHYTHVTLGVGTGEGRIMLLLGLLAVVCGILLTIVWVPQFQVLVGAIGCAIATAAITYGIHLHGVYEIPETHILGYLNLASLPSSPREGLFVLIVGGSAVAAGALLCLAHSLTWIGVATADQRAQDAAAGG